MYACIYIFRGENGMAELIDVPPGTRVKVLSGRAKGKTGVVIKETDAYVYVKVDGLVPPIVRVGKWNVEIIGRGRRSKAR
jgi:hypothetical protein